VLPEEEDCKRLLHMVTLILPRCHRDTMEVLFVFLKWVAQFGHLHHDTGSKIDLGDLAMSLYPTILKARSKNAARPDDPLGGIRVVTALLENQDEYWSVPEEFMGMLRDQEYFMGSMELSSKEFLKKCDTYMRINGVGRNGLAGDPQ
jgi:hypothetical protein